ncbi:efflux RND transporter periplasmic adaptor subunit [Fictibacillus phosphorivorans]|uniref:efflux RND transporter periplasmic adaptor subunit n=1 Tax=Fictibacillus phosphorivorans TaxID=1221500 RepID=UPI002040C549|nr:efflux RND transporter periplasmic adaptor subunit [Fictibacillus phosphorivorans]MCM3718669.1 efflux RND transporter periplasmic adaptor subunit [Fictibacillus phosphorivorans]MCM3776292.1 efflux RND transporter periplasmic adaptor subunit [Fictibacillus phosphorivorans]
MNKWKWIAAGIMIALLLVMNVFIFDKKESSAVVAPRLETTLSKERDFSKKHEVTGITYSKNTFDIYKKDSFGSIKEIMVNIGETVSAGQTLIAYENLSIEKELRSLKKEKDMADVRADHYSSEISKWQSELSNFDEKQDSAETKVRLQEQLSDAELQKDLAENESSALSDEISELENRLDDLSVKSPADGVVSEVNGIQDEKPLITIVGQGNFEVKANVNQEIAGLLTTGDSVQIEAPNHKEKVKGTVQTFLPTKENNSFTLTVLIEEEEAWVEGQPAKIIISEKLAEKAKSVPKKAVLKEDGNQYVLVIIKDKLYKRKVETGIEQNGFVQIKKGLEKDQEVVLNPSPVFVSGQTALKK